MRRARAARSRPVDCRQEVARSRHPEDCRAVHRSLRREARGVARRSRREAGHSRLALPEDRSHPEEGHSRLEESHLEEGQSRPVRRATDRHAMDRRALRAEAASQNPE